MQRQASIIIGFSRIYDESGSDTNTVKSYVETLSIVRHCPWGVKENGN